MNKFKFSCADFTFPLLSHDKALQVIKLLGVEGVDLGLFEDRSHHYPSAIAKDPVKEGSNLYNKLKGFGLSAADVFLQTGKEPHIAAANNPDKAVRTNNRNLFLKILDFACEVSSEHITGLPGVFHEGEDPKNDWERACDETNWRLEAASAKGLTYSIEPHLGSVSPDPASILLFISDCPGLTLTLDYGHFIYQGLSNESVHPLIHHASHFHARGGAKGKLQTMVEENEIDFRAIMQRFKEIKYSGYICMEYVYDEWGNCNRTDNVSETILLHDLLNRLAMS